MQQTLLQERPPGETHENAPTDGVAWQFSGLSDRCDCSLTITTTAAATAVSNTTERPHQQCRHHYQRHRRSLLLLPRSTERCPCATFAPRRLLARKRWRSTARLFIVNLAAFLVKCATNAFKALANEDTLLPTQMFPCFSACATFVVDTNFVSAHKKMFLILFRNILCPQQMFPSLRSPRNMMGNNVSSFARAFTEETTSRSIK